MPAELIAERALEFSRAFTELRSLVRQRIQSSISASGLDLSFELLEIIGLLWRRDGITQQEIADTVSKDKSSMTYLINSLVKRGLVTRNENENDRRNRHIFLTEKGKHVRKTIFPLVLDVYREAAGNLQPEELEASLQLVKKMTANLQP